MCFFYIWHLWHFDMWLITWAHGQDIWSCAGACVQWIILIPTRFRWGKGVMGHMGGWGHMGNGYNFLNTAEIFTNFWYMDVPYLNTPWFSMLAYNYKDGDGFKMLSACPWPLWHEFLYVWCAHAWSNALWEAIWLNIHRSLKLNKEAGLSQCWWPYWSHFRNSNPNISVNTWYFSISFTHKLHLIGFHQMSPQLEFYLLKMLSNVPKSLLLLTMYGAMDMMKIF